VSETSDFSSCLQFYLSRFSAHEKGLARLSVPAVEIFWYRRGVPGTSDKSLFVL
jgi:hypothetical protein